MAQYARFVRVTRIQFRRCQTNHLTRGHQLGRHICDLELQRLELRQLFTELLTLVHVVSGTVQCSLCSTNRTGRNVDAAAIQAFHCDLEAVTFVTQQSSSQVPQRLQK